MSVREKIQEFEARVLSPYAQLSKNTRGREKPEQECDHRTPYQKDRDKIIHTVFFRKLKSKTQVFLTTLGEQFRTRLTHTLEVAQISRTIARALRLNEDLVEAIALGHDLGHTPFGHIGEKVLNDLYPEGFHHSEQSLRVVTFLAREGKGLNLTYEVLDGIKKHSKILADFMKNDKGDPITLEGMVVRISDTIAYLNHDIDDAVHQGILSLDDLPKDIIKVLGKEHGDRISKMVSDIIENSMNNERIVMSAEVFQATNELRKFMFENVYISNSLSEIGRKAERIMRALYEYYADNPDKLFEKVPEKWYTGNVEKLVCDYLSSMSDVELLQDYSNIFLIRPLF